MMMMMRKRRVVVVEHRYTVADVLSRTLEPILDCGSKVILLVRSTRFNTDAM